MKISCCWLYAISKYGYPAPVADMLQAVKDMAALGFKYIELEGVREKNLLEVEAHKREFQELCSRLDLEVINFCPVLPDVISLDEARRKHAIELFARAVELARFFGCRTIQIDSYAPPLHFAGERIPYKDMDRFGERYQVEIPEDFSWPRLWETLVRSVQECSDLAEEGGLPLCLEPRVGEIVSNTDALLRLMDWVGRDNFGAVLDTGHLHAQKEIISLSVEKLGSKIFFVHVSDNDGRDNLHLELGQGTIDWKETFRILKKIGYEGHVSVDIGHVPNIDQAYRNSLRFLEDMTKQLHF